MAIYISTTITRAMHAELAETAELLQLSQSEILRQALGEWLKVPAGIKERRGRKAKPGAKRTLAVSMDKALHERIGRLAYQRDMSVSALVREWIHGCLPKVL